MPPMIFKKSRRNGRKHFAEAELGKERFFYFYKNHV